MRAQTHTLVDRFQAAGLTLRLAAAPLARTGTAAIVQLDIGRGKSRVDEHFRLWAGDASNRVEVQGTDRTLEQLVLMVHEPRRRFEVETSRFAAERNPALRVVRTQGRRAWVEQFTDARKRHFLCGMDERHCFIAQLPQPVSSVHRAHEVLRPPALPDLPRRAQKGAVRQGEFFFVPLDEATRKRFFQLGTGIAARRHVGIALAANWSRAGRQHLATEVWPIAPAAANGGIVLVRGHVVHPDHRTVHFPEWVRVLQNREAYEAPPPGVLWVD